MQYLTHEHIVLSGLGPNPPGLTNLLFSNLHIVIAGKGSAINSFTQPVIAKLGPGIN